MLLLIDNYDSFTYNLAHLFGELGMEVLVQRNDAISVEEAERLAPSHVVISPGPGRPEAAGVSEEIVRAFAGRVPVLGVCLGHQAIVTVFGGEVGAAQSLVHGKSTQVERFSHVTHLVSEVAGEIRDGVGAWDLLRATFPAGTVSGAPKVRAMQIISELEGYRRGFYAGVVGYHIPGVGLDTCIALRTALLAGAVAYLQAGGGIVVDSDPAAEHRECLQKLAAVERAIEAAEAR